jgi:hypothetical protein
MLLLPDRVTQADHEKSHDPAVMTPSPNQGRAVLDCVKTAHAPLRGGLRPVSTQSARSAADLCGPGRFEPNKKHFLLTKGVTIKERRNGPLSNKETAFDFLAAIRDRVIASSHEGHRGQDPFSVETYFVGMA